MSRKWFDDPSSVETPEDPIQEITATTAMRDAIEAKESMVAVAMQELLWRINRAAQNGQRATTLSINKNINLTAAVSICMLLQDKGFEVTPKAVGKCIGLTVSWKHVS